MQVRLFLRTPLMTGGSLLYTGDLPWRTACFLLQLIDSIESIEGVGRLDRF